MYLSTQVLAATHIVHNLIKLINTLLSAKTQSGWTFHKIRVIPQYFALVHSYSWDDETRTTLLTKNTPMILKAKLDIKLRLIMSPFISRLLLGQKSVASYWKMGR